jgi:NAD(P)-dependent dehydrogenase (short-subunit alcohol dehydrogenase family)
MPHRRLFWQWSLLSSGGGSYCGSVETAQAIVARQHVQQAGPPISLDGNSVVRTTNCSEQNEGTGAMSQIGSSKRVDWPLAVVVGAGGMGMAVARRLGQSYRLLLVDRDEDHLTLQLARLKGEGHDVTTQRCDVACAQDVAELARRALEAGPVAALAQVVGLSPSLGDFATIMSVNLIGAARVVEAFGEIMVAGGAAVCIASSAAHMQSVPDDLLHLLDAPLHEGFLPRITTLLGERATSANAYTLSKKGLIRLVQRNAVSWGARGLRIISLSPGLIASPQGAGEYKHSPSKSKLFETVPLSREGTLLEIAGVVDFLLSDKASYISGTDILVDGGLIAGLGCRKFG